MINNNIKYQQTMANYIQIRAKKASDVIGAGIISYALIGSFLLYKFHINLMEYLKIGSLF